MVNENGNQIFSEEDVIFKYSSNQAVEDGFLLDVSVINPKWKNGIISHITTNLLGRGYFKEDKSLNVPNIVDLLNQAAQIIKSGVKGDWFYSGIIELPDGTKTKIFISQNETGRFTAMLPEDY